MKKLTDKEYKLNMPKTIGKMLKVLFKDDSWSWMGLAQLMVNEIGISDLGELDMFIKQFLEDKK